MTKQIEYDYQITPRSLGFGGGWDLRLLENGEQVVTANSTQNTGTITQSGAVPGNSLVADSISNDGVINFGSPVVEPPVVEPPVVEPPVVEPPQGTTKASVQVVFDDSKSGVTASGLTLQVGVGEQPGQLSNAKLNIE